MADHNSIEDQLVDDRELTDSASDRFRHTDIVEQLADLTATAPTPSSIGLFAPWGAGKSSIYNLLLEKLESSETGIRLVRYDAFRYAKLPLQRHFLQSLGQALDLKSADFADGLYEGSQSNSIRFGDRTDSGRKVIGQLMWVFAMLIGAAILLALTLLSAIGILAVLTSDTKALSDFGDIVFDLAKNSLVGFVAPAGLLALVSGVAGKSLWVTRQRSAPTSEEEFGATFEALVEAALESKKHGRLVVFVDELDRCTPETVVETLDSLRTFLGAKGCIFIVAADQAVLEEALTQRVKQATPNNRSNPYYSSGSEYLDKTFHYQMQVPPLLSRRLSGFAAGLVRDKPGVWQTVHSVDAVVSVLIPNHVRSPRRAKTLLNSFALAFDLGTRRMTAGHIADDLPSRGRELALLTCLRVEFPLLAAELQQYPELITALRSELGLPVSLAHQHSEDVVTLARQFLAGRRPTDQLLTGDPIHNHPTLERPPGATLPESEPDVESVDETADDSPATTAVRARQLELYLRKTARVPPPRQDLIHLEGRGARFGLDAHLADELDDAGSQGDIEQVREILDRLGDNHAAGIRALAESLDRDAAPLGEEASNLATTLLRVYAERAGEISQNDEAQLTNQCAAAIDAHLEAYELRYSDLPGGLALGLDSGSDHGTSLANAVLIHPGAKAKPDVAIALLSRLDSLSRLDPEDVHELFAHALAGDSGLDQLAAAFEAAPPHQSVGLLQEARPTLTRLLKPKADADDVDEETRRENAKSQQARYSRLLRAFVDLDGGTHQDMSRTIALAILKVGSTEARNAVSPLLGELATTSTGLVDDDDLADALVEAASRRVISDMPKWLARVPPDRPSSSARAAADRMATKAWKDRDNEDQVPDDDEALITELHRILPTPLGADSELISAISSELGAVSTPTAAVSQGSIRDAYLGIIDAGLIEASSVAVEAHEHIVGALRSAIPTQHLANESVLTYHLDIVYWAVRNGTWDVDEPLSQSVMSSTWILSPQCERLAINVSAIEAQQHGLEQPPLDGDELLQLIDEHGSDFGEPATLWIANFADSPTAAFEMLDIVLDKGVRVEGTVRSILVEYAEALDDSELMDFLGPEIAKTKLREPRFDLLKAANFGRLPANDVSERLTMHYDSATNNEQRNRILDLWQAHGVDETKARQRLFESVIYPMAELNAQALDLILRRHQLLATAPDRNEVRLRLGNAADRLDRRPAADQAMVKANLKKRRPRAADILGGDAKYDDID